MKNKLRMHDVGRWGKGRISGGKGDKEGMEEIRMEGKTI